MKSLYFIFIFEIYICGYRILGQQCFFPFSPLRMLFHCLLTCVVSGDKFAVIFVLISLQVTSIFSSGCFQDFLFITSSEQFDFDVCWLVLFLFLVISLRSVGLQFSPSLKTLESLFLQTHFSVSSLGSSMRTIMHFLKLFQCSLMLFPFKKSCSLCVYFGSFLLCLKVH